MHCVPQTTITSLAASDTDIIDADADMAADENSAELEVSTDDSADDSDTVSDEELAVPTDTGEQPETTGDDTEVESTEGGEQGQELAEEPDLTLDTEVVEPDKVAAGSELDVNFEYATDEVTDIIVKKGAALEEVAENAKALIATNATAGSNGEVYPAEVYQYTATPKPGYQITSIKAYNDADKPTEPGKDWADVTEIKASALEGEEGSQVQTLTIGTDFNVAAYDTITIVVTGAKIKYDVTVTLPTDNSVSKLEYTECDADNTDFTAVDEWTEWTTGAIQAEHGNALGFKITPAAGFKVTGVSNTSYIDADGVYVTGAITEEAAFVVSTEATEQPAETFTVSFENYTDKATSHYEIYQLTPTADGKYTKAAAASTSLSVTKGTDVYFAIEPDDMYNVKAVKASGVKKETVTVVDGSTDTQVDAYCIDKVSRDTTIAVKMGLDKENAYKAEFTTAENGDSKYTITTNSTGIDTNIETNVEARTRTVYTALSSIAYTITPNRGYQIEKIQKVATDGTKEDVTEFPANSSPSTTPITVAGTFSASEKSAKYEVTVTAVPLGEAKKVTFKNDAPNLTLEVKTETGKVEEAAGEEGTYTISTGTQYFEFTLTSNNPKVTPKVVEEGNGDGEEWLFSDTDVSPYQYKVPASLFTKDTTLTIQQEAVRKILTVGITRDVLDLFGSVINWADTTAMVGDTTYEHFDDTWVGTDGELYGVDFDIPIDSEVKLTVQAQADYKIASYKIGSQTEQEVNAKTAEISVTLTDDTVVIITPANDPAPYEILLKNVSSAEAIEAVNDIYSVNYNQEYTVSLMKKDADGEDVFSTLGKATLTLANEEPCATALTQTPNGTDSNLRFTIDAQDAGETLLLKLWDVDASMNDNSDPSATLTLKVANAITKATITGVNRGKLTQTVDTQQSYEIKVTPADADVNNLDADIKWAEDATDADKAAFTAAVADGKLVITVPTAKDPNAVAALNTAAGKADISLADKTKGAKGANGNYPDDAIIKDSGFKLTIAAPEALDLTGRKAITPTLKLKSSDDISLTLTLGVPANAKLPELVSGKLWYEVKVKLKNEGDTDVSGNTITAEKTYYFAKEEGKATQDETITVNRSQFGSGVACDYIVNAKVVQTLDGTDMADDTVPAETKTAALTAFESKPAKALNAATKAPYYATKLTLKKGTTTVYTGMENIKIATIDFGKNTTFTNDEYITVEDITTGLTRINKYTGFKVKDGAVYLSLPLAKNGYVNVGPGKHTIRVTAQAPTQTQAVYADITITVNRGIENLSLAEASDRIYREKDGKAASLKVTPVYNEGNTKNNYEAKTKKVKEYVLVAADGYGNRKTDENGNDVIIKDTTLTVKNGTVTVAKAFKLEEAKQKGIDKFFVRATSADWSWTDKVSKTSGSSSVYGYSNLITIENTKLGLKDGSIVVVREEYDEQSRNWVYKPVLSGSDQTATSGEFGEYDTENGTYPVYIVVLKKGQQVQESYNAEELAAACIDSEYLTYKSSKAKVLAVNKDGYITVVKPGTKIKLTVSANDGSKESVSLDKLTIENAKPAELGLQVELWDNNGGGYGNDYSYHTLDRLDKDNTAASFNDGTASSVLRLTVVRREEGDEWWHELDEYTDLKVSFGKTTKVLNKVSTYNQQYLVRANAGVTEVKLDYTDDAGTKVKDIYKITNNGVNQINKTAPKAAPKTKNQNLVAGWYENDQILTYTLNASSREDYKDKVVMVTADAADRYNVKNRDRYNELERNADSPYGLNSYIPINPEDGSFDLHFGMTGNVWENDKIIDTYTYTYILAGSYKLQFTYGTVAPDGAFIAETKPAAVTIKAVAPKTVKGSYKPASTVKMSTYDTAAGVKLAGTGKNYSNETYYNLLNANTTGQANHFKELFTLGSDNMLRLNTGNFTQGFREAVQKSEKLSAPATDEQIITYITSSKTKEAKNDRTGYVTYSVNIADKGTERKTVKITVTFNTTKSIAAYTLTNATILEGTPKVSVDVLANKKSANIKDAYVYESTKEGVFTAPDEVASEGYSSITLTGNNAPNKYKVTLYIVPENSFYADEIATLKQAWINAAEAGKDTAEKAYVNAITEKGVKVTTTIDVKAKATTKGKISVEKKALSQTFTGVYTHSQLTPGVYMNDAGYSGIDQEYYIHVAYTKKMPCEIAYIDSDDNYLQGLGFKDDNNNDINNLINFYDGVQDWDEERGDYGTEFINITVKKEQLEKAVKEGNVNYSTAGRKATIKVKATVHFGVEQRTDEQGNSYWDTQYDDTTGKDAIQTEDITFTLTLPLEPGVPTYAAAVTAVMEAHLDDIKKAVPNSWNYWNGEGWQSTEEDAIIINARSKDDNGKDKWNELYGLIDETLNAVENAIAEYAPEDSDIRIQMTQKDDKAEIIRLAVGDFKEPTTDDTGSLTVRALLINAATLGRDAQGNEIIITDQGDKNTETTEAIFTLTLPARKENPADVKEALQAYVTKKAAETDYVTNETGWDKIAADAREELGLTKDGITVNTLRLTIEENNGFKPATKGYTGYYQGTFHIWGYRYGGEIRQSFNFTIAALPTITGAVDKVNDALGKIQATNSTDDATILAAAENAIVGSGFQIGWKTATAGEKAYKKTPATRDAAGSIKGVLLLTDPEAAEDDADAAKEVEVNLIITKLADATEVVTKVKKAVGFKEDGTAVDKDNLIKLILEYGNEEAKVKEGILAAANAAVANDGYTVAYKKDTADTPADLFSFTPVKYKATGTQGEAEYDNGEGSISFTLAITDNQAEEGSTTTIDDVEMSEQTFGPLPTLQTLEDAVADVTAALETYKATITTSTIGNAVTAEAIMSALTTPSAVVTGEGLNVAVDKESFVKVDATVKAAGSITCDVVITKTVDGTVADTETVKFEVDIPKAAQDLEAAKTAAENVLKGLGDEYFTNNNHIDTVPDAEGDEGATKDVVNAEVLKEIENAVKDVVDTDSFTVEISEEAADYTVTKATIKTAGSVKITVVITDTKTTTNSPVKASYDWTIIALDQSAEEAQAAAEKAIADYIKDSVYADGIDDTAAADLDSIVAPAIVNAIKEVVKTDVYTVAATEDADNSNAIFIKDETDTENPVYKAEFTLTYTGEGSPIKLTATIKVKAAAAPNPSSVTPANSVSANDSTR
ncbi:MAG: hypothetical protein NC419_09060 [Muribaculaceae bacterium]|nr:hypothetical protein [Muribaculaceae bacterium]